MYIIYEIIYRKCLFDILNFPARDIKKILYLASYFIGGTRFFNLHVCIADKQ